MENHAEIIHQKLVPDVILILINNTKQPLHAEDCFKRIQFFLKEDYQKA